MKEFNIPASIVDILNILSESGYEAYIVGGAVRDFMLNKKPKDYDIATNASINEMLSIFKNYKIIETGLKHGTISLALHEMNIEITTYRDLDNSLQGDLLMRDFTINAIAYSSTYGIIDYYNGINDIKSKIIRINGIDDSRFIEDPLRILRAIRLSSTLNFSIEEKTKKYILKNAHLLNNVSKERIKDELIKILLSDYPSIYIREYFDIFTVFINELIPLKGFEQNNPYHIYDCLEHTLKVMDNVESDIVMRLAALFHDSGKPFSYTEDDKHIGHFYEHYKISIDITKKVLKRLKFSNEIIDRVIHLIHYHDYPLTLTKKSIRKLLNYFKTDDIYNLLALKKADILAQNKDYISRLDTVLEAKRMIDEIIDNNECFSLRQLNINGKDLQLMGVIDGKEIGIVLKELLDLVINNKIPNDHNKLLERAKMIIKRKR